MNLHGDGRFVAADSARRDLMKLCAVKDLGEVSDLIGCPRGVITSILNGSRALLRSSLEARIAGEAEKLGGDS